MNKFELSSAFLIGHEKIDSDHVALVETLNVMVDAFTAKDIETCQKTWLHFCAQLKQHFIDETKIMNDFGYIEKDQGNDHQEILKHINTLGQDHNSLSDWEDCLLEMRNNLLSWILKHDLRFAQHLITIGYNPL